MNKVLTAMDKSGSFRVYLTISTDLVEEARQIHQTTPLGTAALGRVLTGAGLMGLLLKNDQDKLTTIFKGDGPARQILATANSKGEVKGYISNPDVDLPLRPDGKLDVGGALGIGELTVIKDLGLKEPFIGTIALASGEIAEDLTAYYYISEQQNSAISLGVKIETDYTVGAAGGMIIQLLPNFKDEAVDALEAMLAKLPPITTLIDEVNAEKPEASHEEKVSLLGYKIFGSMPEEYTIKHLDMREIKWECDCSEERLEKALMTIGVKDLEEIIEEDGQAEMVCQFCLKQYLFDKEHLERLVESIK